MRGGSASPAEETEQRCTSEWLRAAGLSDVECFELVRSFETRNVDWQPSPALRNKTAEPVSRARGLDFAHPVGDLVILSCRIGRSCHDSLDWVSRNCDDVLQQPLVTSAGDPQSSKNRRMAKRTTALTDRLPVREMVMS